MNYQRKNRKNQTKKLAVGTSMAAAAGFVAGILTAPRSGQKTINQLKKSGQKGLRRADSQYAKTQDQLNQALDDAKLEAAKLSGKAKDELNDAAAKAQLAKDKTQTVFDSVRRGATSDKDLQKALDNAKSALKNLKDYLQK
ncbi:MAG: YtxH domain-containing protein [Candidatus Saccharimonadales bacterium]